MLRGAAIFLLNISIVPQWKLSYKNYVKVFTSLKKYKFSGSVPTLWSLSHISCSAFVLPEYQLSVWAVLSITEVSTGPVKFFLHGKIVLVFPVQCSSSVLTRALKMCCTGSKKNTLP